MFFSKNIEVLITSLNKIVSPQHIYIVYIYIYRHDRIMIERSVGTISFRPVIYLTIPEILTMIYLTMPEILKS